MEIDRGTIDKLVQAGVIGAARLNKLEFRCRELGDELSRIGVALLDADD